MQPWKIKPPPNIKCPFKCDKGWKGETEITPEGKKWTAWSQCAGCGAYSVWDFNPEIPLEKQQLWVKESYEGFPE